MTGWASSSYSLHCRDRQVQDVYVCPLSLLGDCGLDDHLLRRPIQRGPAGDRGRELRRASSKYGQEWRNWVLCSIQVCWTSSETRTATAGVSPPPRSKPPPTSRRGDTSHQPLFHSLSLLDGALHGGHGMQQAMRSKRPGLGRALAASSSLNVHGSLYPCRGTAHARARNISRAGLVGQECRMIGNRARKILPLCPSDTTFWTIDDCNRPPNNERLPSRQVSFSMHSIRRFCRHEQGKSSTVAASDLLSERYAPPSSGDT